MKNIRFFYLKKKNHFFLGVVKFSMYLNGRVFIMTKEGEMYNDTIKATYETKNAHKRRRTALEELPWNGQ